MIKVENVKAFLAALALACKVTARASKSLPALATVRLTADGKGNVVTSATDLETWQLSRVPAEGELDVAVNAKALATVLKKLGKDPFTLAKGEKLEIRSGKRKLALDLFDVANLPETPAPDTKAVEFDKAKLYRDMAFVAASVSKDEYRRNLAAIHFECNGNIALMVTTDGHRLSKVMLAADAGRLTKDFNVPSNVATSMLETMKTANGSAPSVLLGCGDGYVAMVCGPHYVMGKVNDERFPPYDRVIPSYHEIEIQLDAADLRGAMDLSKAVNSRSYNETMVTFAPDGITVRAEGSDTGEVSETVAATYPEGFDESKVYPIGFNASYILDALKDRDGEITLRFTDALGPMSITGGSENPTAYSLVMPLRI